MTLSSMDWKEGLAEARRAAQEDTPHLGKQYQESIALAACAQPVISDIFLEFQAALSEAGFDQPGVEMRVGSMLKYLIDRHMIGDVWWGTLESHIREIRRAMDNGPSGFIYVLEAQNAFKIGRTKNLEDRIGTLRIQLPFPVEVMTAFPCEDHIAAEKHLHRELAHFRTNGEWFQLDYGAQLWLNCIEFCLGREDDFYAEFYHRTPSEMWGSSAWEGAFLKAEQAKGEQR